MKQLFKAKEGISVLEVPLPTPGPKEILIDVQYSVISSGTETLGMKKEEKRIKERLAEKIELLNKLRKKFKQNGLKLTLESVKRKLLPDDKSILYRPAGYSNAGVIVAKGYKVQGFNVGDRVACAGGGFASHSEYSIVPVNLAIKLPKKVLLKEAAFTTLGSIAMQGLRRASLTGGESVVIYGLGLLGLLAVQIAKAWGLKVIGTDINSKRLNIANEMGADYCFLSSEEDFENNVLEVTNGIGADAVIVYASSQSSQLVNTAMKISRQKGRVVLVGSVGMNLNRNYMYQKELDILMSTSYGPGRYDDNYEKKGFDYPIGYVRWTENRNMLEFINLLEEKKVKVSRLISNIFNISQAQEAFNCLIKDPDANIANLFEYKKSSNKKYPKKKFFNITTNFSKNKINVGIIGAGSFMKRHHLKNIQKLGKYYRLIAGANNTPLSSDAIGKECQLEYVTTNYKEILDDKNIDMVIVGTRHNLHAQIVIDAIRANKHILVEKPLALNKEELSQIEKALKNNPSINVTVGFNRRYSSLIQKIQELIQRGDSPVMINYRINAGYIPPDNWVHDPEIGGGRIHGECCHFIDLVNYLVQSDLIHLEAIAIPVDGQQINSEDNLIITMKYSNGSIGVITYTAIGGRDMKKERIEIFYNRTSIILDDFSKLKLYNCGERNINLTEMDKGFFKEIEEFAKLIRGEKSLIPPFELDFLSTEVTQSVVDKIHGHN